MKNHDRINACRGIERKRAHIIGGGIAGFATAAFLIDDAHMPRRTSLSTRRPIAWRLSRLLSARKKKGYRNRDRACGALRVTTPFRRR